MNAVEMTNITKQYPLVRALDQVNFTLKKGEIHSLLGENGAGKSTLMKVLYGMCRPDEGEIQIYGKKATIHNSKQAMDLGIGMVHQHFMLTPVLTVAENIIIGKEPCKGLFLDEECAKKQVGEMIERYGFHISPTEKVADLSVGEQQKVEILKALYHGAEILILDEPTAVLTPQEVSELFVIMRELKEQGKSIVIITHKLKETLEIADRMSVLRDGTMVEAGLMMEHATARQLAHLMVGRDVELGIVRKTESVGEVSVSAEHITLMERGKKVLSDLNFSLHKSEILGIAGIEGNGQTELIEVMTGLRKADQGDIIKDGKKLEGGSAAFINHKIGHVPEDRQSRGLVTPLSIKDNIILGYHRKKQFSKRGILNEKGIRKYAHDLMDEYGIKAPNPEEKCQVLSGGNQQKVVISRVFSEEPDALIIAQPTRGVDIGAMEYIHNKLLDLRDEGKAILLISADLDEVKCLSDRLAVIYDGKLVAMGKPDEFDDISLGLLMTSGKLEEKG